MLAALSRTCDLGDFEGCLTVADWQQELADAAWQQWLDAHHIRTREESLVVNYSGIPFIAPGPSALYQYPGPWPGTTTNGLTGTQLAAVWGLNVLNHIEAPVKFLQRACQILRPHGLLFLTFLAWNAEGADCAMGHDRRRRIYDMQSRQKLISECRKIGLVVFGGVDWAYHGHWLDDHTLASLVLTRKGGAMFDVKCRELAKAFLDDQPEEDRTPQHINNLAQVIQDAVEGYLLDLDVTREPEA